MMMTVMTDDDSDDKYINAHLKNVCNFIVKRVLYVFSGNGYVKYIGRGPKIGNFRY
jgi:hypothetical protein